jgi:hypothetical protein
MPETTVFLLDIIDSNSLHGPIRELHQDNGISNQINQSILVSVLGPREGSRRLRPLVNLLGECIDLCTRHFGHPVIGCTRSMNTNEVIRVLGGSGR